MAKPKRAARLTIDQRRHIGRELERMTCELKKDKVKRLSEEYQVSAWTINDCKRLYDSYKKGGANGPINLGSLNLHETTKDPNMPNQITAWKDAKGNLHETIEAAILADADLELHAWIEGAWPYEGSWEEPSPNNIKEMIKDHAEQLHEILTKYIDAKHKQMHFVPCVPWIKDNDPARSEDL